jgi:DUF1680 family protein
MEFTLLLWMILGILRKRALPVCSSPAAADTSRYSQSHLPLKEQPTIEGHSVRALYLTTAAADLGGEYLDVAKRLWDDAIDKKMYATGGLGSRPRVCSLCLESNTS